MRCTGTSKCKKRPGRTSDIRRQTILNRIARLHDTLGRHAQDLIDAISTDFGHRSAHETILADLLYVELAVREARGHL